jgi:hypothetical protein
VKGNRAATGVVKFESTDLGVSVTSACHIAAWEIAASHDHFIRKRAAYTLVVGNC